MSKKTKKKIIKVARKTTKAFVELMEEVVASAVHLIGYIALGVGLAVILCLFWKIIDTRGVFKNDLDLYLFGIRYGIAFGALYAVSKRIANFLTRLDIKREREERRLAEQLKEEKDSDNPTFDDEERWSA